MKTLCMAWAASPWTLEEERVCFEIIGREREKTPIRTFTELALSTSFGLAKTIGR